MDTNLSGSIRRNQSEEEQLEMLVELFDLRPTPEGGENWTEAGRWIKYEEDVEGVDKHWGRPHVAFLAYHSLMQLRQCFSTGVLLFDLEAPDMASIISKLTSSMVTDFGVDSATADNFLNTLKVERFRKDSSKRFSSRRSSHGKGHRSSKRHGSVYSNQAGPLDSDPDGERKHSAPRKLSTTIMESMERQLGWSHHEDVHGGAAGVNYAARDPVEAELCQVYAGVMSSLTTIRFFMVRLAEPIHMPDLRSSYMPLRFLFLVAGPPMPDVDYHELGRSIGTLMAENSFKKVAFTAKSRDQIVRGFDHFLDFSVVVPPGDIDTADLLTADDARKALENRKRLKAASGELVGKQHKKSAVIDEEKVKPPPLPPGPLPSRVDHVADSLRRTGRLFGGVIEDIKYRAPYYWRDFRDALHHKTVTATLFMFFANFASAVAFGEVMEEKTEGYMGATEMLLAHAICGVVWGFIACQPMCIQAAVGPFLVLEASLYTFSKGQGLEFLAFRWWTGLWTFIMMIVTAALEGPFVMRYLTRFTEDIFTSLIAFIFIWEAGKYILTEVTLHPLHALSVYCGYYQESVGNISQTVFVNESFLEYDLPPDSANWTLNNGVDEITPSKLTNQPNTALLSFILVIFTFILSFTLKRLGTSPYFGRLIRKTLSDFGVPLSVLIVILIYQLFFKDTHIRHVDSTPYLSLTNASLRDWLVNPMGTASKPLPVWAIFAAIIPAFFVAILVYAEVEIIEVLLARRDRGLKRPHGFHWDLIVCGGLAWVCSLFGMPWMCPGAVQSLSHANALVVYKRAAPGEAPKLDYVVEQRVSCMLVGILHGAAAFAGVALVLIPVPVLFGLFLLLGVMGLIGIQFVHRLELLFIPQKYFPDLPYCRGVSMWRMHLFTFIQLLCFGVLWAVNMVKTIAMAFPFVLTLISLFRMFIMPRIFKPHELEALDGKPDQKPPPAPANDNNDNHVHNEISKTIGIKM